MGLDDDAGVRPGTHNDCQSIIVSHDSLWIATRCVFRSKSVSGPCIGTTVSHGIGTAPGGKCRPNKLDTTVTVVGLAS